jgi:hypothetical protein
MILTPGHCQIRSEINGRIRSPRQEEYVYALYTHISKSKYYRLCLRGSVAFLKIQALIMI